ncbi:hypothetical protein GCM10010466_08770 [Planomonospora alba]|uniref:Aminoglycoside phosphotransferase domain-containing protein n=1 Tax=Planomonospora alba TaxID=161354 RepID=A0ABP6MN28_9ACTN
MSTATEALLAVAQDTLGPVTVERAPDLPAHLTLLADAAGDRYLLKRHTDPERFHAEIHAYTAWRPQLGARAPHLVAFDEGSCSLLVTYVPGRRADRLRPGSTAEERAHRGAGETLRLLHAVPLEQPAVDVAAFLAGRMLHWAVRAHAAALIDQAELRTLHRHAEELAATPMDGVICHLDYQPRNWIVQPDGGIAVIDFEHTRPDALVRDLARLAFRRWPHRPRLREEFLTGYGRDLSDEEERLLSRFAAVEALTSMVRGDERGDPRLFAYGKALLAAIL